MEHRPQKKLQLQQRQRQRGLLARMLCLAVIVLLCQQCCAGKCSNNPECKNTGDVNSQFQKNFLDSGDNKVLVNDNSQCSMKLKCSGDNKHIWNDEVHSEMVITCKERSDNNFEYSVKKGYLLDSASLAITRKIAPCGGCSTSPFKDELQRIFPDQNIPDFFQTLGDSDDGLSEAQLLGHLANMTECAAAGGSSATSAYSDHQSNNSSTSQNPTSATDDESSASTPELTPDSTASRSSVESTTSTSTEMPTISTTVDEDTSSTSAESSTSADSSTFTSIILSTLLASNETTSSATPLPTTVHSTSSSTETPSSSRFNQSISDASGTSTAELSVSTTVLLRTTPGQMMASTQDWQLTNRTYSLVIPVPKLLTFLTGTILH